MSDPLHGHRPVAPNPRVTDAPEEGYFFPGEVADLLGLRDADYHQLRRLFRLVRAQSGAAPPAGRAWSRYTLTDIAALEVALAICGGPAALARGRRLQLAPLERACESLRGMGVENPLLDVRLERRGRRILATIDGLLFDPSTGQTALAHAFELVSPQLENEPQGDLLAGLLRTERRRRVTRKRATRAVGTESF